MSRKKEPPKLTMEIVTGDGNSLVKVYGKASKRGWKILEGGGAKADPLATEKYKEKAISLAIHCGEETPHSTLIVIPS